jgi:hypothetical protein
MLRFLIQVLGLSSGPYICKSKQLTDRDWPLSSVPYNIFEAALASFYVNLPQGRVIREEGILIEKISSWDWPGGFGQISAVWVSSEDPRKIRLLPIAQECEGPIWHWAQGQCISLWQGPSPSGVLEGTAEADGGLYHLQQCEPIFVLVCLCLLMGLWHCVMSPHVISSAGRSPLAFES